MAARDWSASRGGASPHKDTDGNALPDVEDVLISRSASFPRVLLAIAVQVKHVDGIEALHETAAHSAKGGIIKVAVIGDEGQDARARAFDAPLSIAHELDIIIIEPFRVALVERYAVNCEVAGDALARPLIIAMQQLGNPRVVISRMTGIRRIAHDH